MLFGRALPAGATALPLLRHGRQARLGRVAQRAALALLHVVLLALGRHDHRSAVGHAVGPDGARPGAALPDALGDLGPGAGVKSFVLGMVERVGLVVAVGGVVLLVPQLGVLSVVRRGGRGGGDGTVPLGLEQIFHVPLLHDLAAGLHEAGDGDGRQAAPQEADAHSHHDA